MSLQIYTSTVANGSMKSLHAADIVTVATNRADFLASLGIEPRDTTLLRLTYNRADFCEYYTLAEEDKGDGITRESTRVADALVVTAPGHALLLPLADCIGAVIHDSVQNILMLSHLGRHNLEQVGGTKSIEYLAKKHGCAPKNLSVWLSPAAGKNSYPLYAFNNRSLHDVAAEQLVAGGVLYKNISVSPIDVATDETYFSHSQFLKGNRSSDGRHAVVAVLS